MAATIISNEDLRIFLQDKAELNPLLSGVRFDDKMIDRASITVVDAFNTMLPPNGTSYTVENFPYRYLLLIGVCGYLLKGAAINEASNNFTYSVDGVQVNDKDKAQIFSSLGREFWEEFKQMTKDIKVAQNVQSCFGRTYSEYIYNPQR